MDETTILPDDITEWTRETIEEEYDVPVLGYQYDVFISDGNMVHRESLSPDSPRQISDAHDGAITNLDPLVPLSEALRACKEGAWDT